MAYRCHMNRVKRQQNYLKLIMVYRCHRPQCISAHGNAVQDEDCTLFGNDEWKLDDDLRGTLV